MTSTGNEGDGENSVTFSYADGLVRILGSKDAMDFQVGQIIKMKKPHPCGANEWKILRIGMDFRLECLGCGRQVMVPRKIVEKRVR